MVLMGGFIMKKICCAGCASMEAAAEYTKQYICILEEMVCRISCAKCGGSISGNFIRLMMPMQQAAARMAEDVPCYTDDRCTLDLACRIRSESEEDMRRLDDVLCCCACISNCPKDVSGHIKKTGRILSSTVSAMKNACGSCDPARDFRRRIRLLYCAMAEMIQAAMCYCLCGELCPIMADMARHIDDVLNCI